MYLEFKNRHIIFDGIVFFYLLLMNIFYMCFQILSVLPFELSVTMLTTHKSPFLAAVAVSHVMVKNVFQKEIFTTMHAGKVKLILCQFGSDESSHLLLSLVKSQPVLV